MRKAIVFLVGRNFKEIWESEKKGWELVRRGGGIFQGEKKHSAGDFLWKMGGLLSEGPWDFEA